jgi:hypothetical protein
MLATSADLPGQDHQVAGLEAAGLLVEVLEARRCAGERGLGHRQPVQLVGLLVQDVRDRADLLLAVVGGDLQHGALRLLHQLSRGCLPGEDAGLDLVGGGEQRAQLEVVMDDRAVLARMAGGRHPPGQLVDRRGAADLVELAVLAQLLRDGEVVDLVVGFVELEHRGEHRTVLLAVEVVGPQLLLDQERVQVTLVQQHRAQHRLLGLEVVGWDGDVLDGAHEGVRG